MPRVATGAIGVGGAGGRGAGVKPVWPGRTAGAAGVGGADGPNADGVARTDCGAATGARGGGAATGVLGAGAAMGALGDGACGRAGMAIGDGAGAGDVGMGIGALARASANTRVGAGAAGTRVAARRAAIAGSLSRSNSASMPWNTSWHWPQRTQPSDTLSWSCTTRKIVPQAGQRVARLMAESYDAKRGITGRANHDQIPHGVQEIRRSGERRRTDQAGLRPVIRIQPSTVLATSSAIHGA